MDEQEPEPFGLWATGRARYQQRGYVPSSMGLRGAAASPPSARPWTSSRYRSSRLRSQVAASLIAACAATYVLQPAIGFAWGILRPAAGVPSSDAIGDASFLLVAGALGTISLALYVLSAVAFLAWLSRVVDNVPALTGATPIHGPREAIGWWFVPLANMFVPYLIVRDTMTILAGTLRGQAGIVTAWWLLFMGSNLVSGVGSVLMSSIGGGASLPAATIAIGGSLMLALAGALLVVIVRRMERWSEAWATSAAQPVDPEPAWPGLDEAELRRTPR